MTTEANQYEINEGDNFFWLLDVSGSMQTSDCVSSSGGKENRITHAKPKIVEYITDGEKYDKDGTTLITFGSSINVIDGITAAKAADIVGKITATESSTRTDLAIAKAYELHKKGGYKQSVAFVVTDGEPTGIGSKEENQEAVKKVLRDIAKDVSERGDEYGFAVSFLTIGVVSEPLRAFLTDLDDNLNAVIDIVDVKAFDDLKSLEEAFAGALHD
jgi:hypothetical protein